MEADGALKMPHAIVVLVCGVVRADLVETVTACKLFDLFFLHAEATHALFTLDAEVHFIADKQTRTSALIMHIRRLI